MRLGLTCMGGAILVIGVTVPAGAQAAPDAGTPAQTLVVGAQLNPSGASNGTSGVTADWIRRAPSGRVFALGGSTYTAGDSRWGLAQVTSSWRTAGGWTASAKTTLGGGRGAQGAFAHVGVRADIARATSRGVLLSGGAEFLDVASSRGLIVRGGATWSIGPAATLDVGAARSIAGNLNTSFAVGRVDVVLKRLTVVGGGALGRSAPAVVALPGTGSTSQTLRQVFGGVGLPIRRTELRVLADIQRLGATTRHSLAVTLSLPVNR